MTAPFRTTDTAVLNAVRSKPQSWLNVVAVCNSLDVDYQNTDAAAEVIFWLTKLEERGKIESRFPQHQGAQFRYKRPKG